MLGNIKVNRLYNASLLSEGEMKYIHLKSRQTFKISKCLNTIRVRAMITLPQRSPFSRSQFCPPPNRPKSYAVCLTPYQDTTFQVSVLLLKFNIMV